MFDFIERPSITSFLPYFSADFMIAMILSTWEAKVAIISLLFVSLINLSMLLPQRFQKVKARFSIEVSP
jgi:hypothetical protein